VFLIGGSIKKWCHLMDSMELQGDLQLNLLIFNDYILDTSYHTNRLELFMERELTSVLTLGLQVNVST